MASRATVAHAEESNSSPLKLKKEQDRIGQDRKREQWMMKKMKFRKEKKKYGEIQEETEEEVEEEEEEEEEEVEEKEEEGKKCQKRF